MKKLNCWMLGSFLSIFFSGANTCFADGLNSGTAYCDSGQNQAFVEEDAKKTALSLVYPLMVDKTTVHVVGDQTGNATAGLASFCKGTTPLKTLKGDVLSYEAQFEPGTPLDYAAIVRNRSLATYRKLAQSYFSATSSSPILGECKNYLMSEPDPKLYFIKRMPKSIMTNGGYYELVFKGDLQKDITQAIREFRFKVGDATNLNSPAQMLTHRKDGKWESIAMPAEMVSKVYFRNEYGKFIYYPLIDPVFRTSTAYSPGEVENFKYEENDDPSKEKDLKMAPLNPVCVGDACFLRSNFLFKDMPDEFQKNALHLKSLLGRDEKTRVWTIESAQRNSDLLWEAYMNHFTTVKELPLGSEHAVKFEVELDLTPFCRYALPRKDMVTQ